MMKSKVSIPLYAYTFGIIDTIKLNETKSDQSGLLNRIKCDLIIIVAIKEKGEDIYSCTWSTVRMARLLASASDDSTIHIGNNNIINKL